MVSLLISANLRERNGTAVILQTLIGMIKLFTDFPPTVIKQETLVLWVSQPFSQLYLLLIYCVWL